MPGDNGEPIMKTHTTIITLSAALAITLLAGCGKQTESPETGTGGEGTSATTSNPNVLTEAVEAAKPAVQQAATEVKDAATAAAADATAKANALIEQAKKLISETKYTEATNLINQLATMKLTPEQEKLVADLKAQIKKALTSLSSTNAAGAVGNLLK